MDYLVDTHILIWWLTDNKRLRSPVQKILKDSNNTIFVSVVSGWEISIKQRSGKLPLKTTVEECFAKSGFVTLDVRLPHVLEVDTLPQIHTDPFDRMLIAQARSENLVLITDDPSIRRYNIKTLA